MTAKDATIGIFTDHQSAEEALKKLVAGGFGMKELSLVGKGFHTEDRVVGFHNIRERIVFWGHRGAFWGGLWGLFSGGVFLTLPIIGHVIILGLLATAVVSAVDEAMVIGGFSALGAALYGLGVHRNTVLEYEAALKSDGFLVIAHGSKMEMKTARDILTRLNPLQLETHENTPHVKAA